MWAAQYFKFDEPNRWMTSGGLGTMGYGLPAAIGTQLANPDGLVIDIAGEASIAKAEKREREEQAVRVAQAIAAAEGRGGNVAGAIVRRVVPKRNAKVTTREDALSVRNSAADAIARFLAERGATRVVLDPVEEAVTGLRRKGYAMTRDGDAWVVDGRHRLAGFADLRDFAARRGVVVSAFLQAAE
ncbi:thiamine pyrophosphate-dependent enzyme [Methylorubrum extorquens]|uniref:Thiamine pyrophosphate TPP-binding domain-containing protein n=1 Tax=Methylorubrum extorquens DSM 13060 TaxID=882800 RepID=H1KBU1_METEX|nr:thiamine pyrophosphate-dependent enzyme [Methylorubrum extorquens]EHP95111.1 thiamine pyrophosphate TPP-binding domain-containing protein [Methylorubrum extorquens DSM 13060]